MSINQDAGSDGRVPELFTRLQRRTRAPFLETPKAPETFLARRQILKSKLVEQGHSQSQKPVVSLTDSFIVSLEL